MKSLARQSETANRTRLQVAAEDAGYGPDRFVEILDLKWELYQKLEECWTTQEFSRVKTQLACLESLTKDMLQIAEAPPPPDAESEAMTQSDIIKELVGIVGELTGKTGSDALREFDVIDVPFQESPRKWDEVSPEELEAYRHAANAKPAGPASKPSYPAETKTPGTPG